MGIFVSWSMKAESWLIARLPAKKVTIMRQLLLISSMQRQLLNRESTVLSVHQGGHGTGKTGNLAVNFSRQGKHREFSKFNFLHRENCANTGKVLKI